MTESEKIARVKTLLMNDPSATDDIVGQYLSFAESTVLDVMFPFGYEDGTVMPRRYETIQCELASRYFARRGALGEISHNENGVNRTFASANDADVLCKIIPHAKVVG